MPVRLSLAAAHQALDKGSPEDRYDRANAANNNNGRGTASTSTPSNARMRFSYTDGDDDSSMMGAPSRRGADSEYPSLTMGHVPSGNYTSESPSRRNESVARRTSRWETEVFASGLNPSSMTCRNLTAVRLLNEGRFDEITQDHIKELFEYLDDDDSGVLEFKEVEGFLQNVLVPPCTATETMVLWELTDQSADGTITFEELYHGVTHHAFREHLQNMHKEAAAHQKLKEALGKNTVVTRNYLFDRMNWFVNRNDAFKTLPFSLLYICVFIAVAVAHLQVWNRQQVQRGIEHWMRGYAGDYPGPYLERHVGDQYQMWEWMELSGLPAILGYCENLGSHTDCRVGGRAHLVGDVRLKKITPDQSEHSEWLLNSDEARAHLVSSPDDLVGAATARLQSLWNSGWAGEEADRLALVYITYTQRVEMFAITEASISLDAYGLAVPRVVTRTVMADPYPNRAVLALDVVYVFLILLPAYQELKDMLIGVQASGVVVGCLEYWDFWNLIDWISIILGGVNCCVWAALVLAIYTDEIQDLLGSDGATPGLIPEAMSLDGKTLDRAELSMRSVVSLIFILQLIMGLNVVSIMLKFFKAFQANPRLQVVTNTLLRAAEDLCHFGIIFLNIFTAFSVSGYVLFGDDLVEFSTFARSVNTSFEVLLGEFGWYHDQIVSDKGLGSGMPVSILAVWFWLYSVLVLLVLLNMLLAIVMDHYNELVVKVRKQTDAPTLWEQAGEFMHNARTNKGYIPMKKLLKMIPDQDSAKKNKDKVNTKYIQAMWPTITGDQAEFLMNWIQKESVDKAKQEADPEIVARLKEVSSLVHSLSDSVRVVALNASLSTTRLQTVETGVNACLNRLQGVEENVVGLGGRLRDFAKDEAQRQKLEAYRRQGVPPVQEDPRFNTAPSACSGAYSEALYGQGASLPGIARQAQAAARIPASPSPMGSVPALPYEARAEETKERKNWQDVQGRPFQRVRQPQPPPPICCALEQGEHRQIVTHEPAR